MHPNLLIMLSKCLKETRQASWDQCMHTARQAWVFLIDQLQDQPQHPQAKINRCELIFADFLCDRLDTISDLLVELLCLGRVLQDLVECEIGHNSSLEVAHTVVRKIRFEDFINDCL